MLYSKEKYTSSSLYLLFFLLFLGKYSIDLGFALKPYMIYLFLFFILFLSSVTFQRLQLFEVGMLLFFFVYCFTGAFSLYPLASIRILVGICLYLFCYFLMKNIISKIPQVKIEHVISVCGIFFNSFSLLLYFLGLLKLNFIFEGDGLYAYGVLMDRDYPRLIGLLQDPNYYVFYNTLFFTYFLCNTNSLKNRFGLALCILTSLLSFSRGGLAALIVVYILSIVILNDPLKQVKRVVGTIITIVLTIYVSVEFLKLDLFSVLQSRIQDFSTDGGSGRFELWGRAMDYFTTNQWIGVGAYNFSDYNRFHYGESLRVHNTFLEILSESGLFGFFGFSLFIGLLIFQLFQFRIHRRKPYLFLAFFGFLLQMASLSIIINDLFFFYLALLAVYVNKESGVHVHNPPQRLLTNNTIKGSAYV
ncbi:O-antigen ligase family protein [Fictibacillus nanhaiensis]|uniref:O-antigen ligase family protein n=1 Tax=Fictibacillus nanhaiensis TaxID=742169 RepID=UPI001C979581|nr:O-antigen ligase family protein [Fictibacillus nanhaiensis]MBY6037222.1 O-antigen ligase family protein [Fictibacillus nanhaiensis]